MHPASKTALVAFVLASLGRSVFGQSVRPTSEAEADVLKVEEAYRLAKLQNDTQALGRILADDYVGTNQYGVRRNKSQVIEIFRTFKLSLTPAKALVQVSSDIAVVSGSQTERNPLGEEQLLFMRVYIKRDGRWQLLSSTQLIGQAQRYLPPGEEGEPQSAEEAYRRAMHSMQVLRVDEGILMFGKAILLKPDWAQAYAARAKALYQAKRYNDAVKDCDEAIRLDPENVAWYNIRGLTYAESGQYARAIEDYSRAINLSPKNAAYYDNRGRALSELGQTEKAIEDLTKAIQMTPDSVKAYENRATAYARMKDWLHAIADCTAAIQVAPTAWQYEKRADAKLSAGDRTGADEDLAKAVQLRSWEQLENPGASFASVERSLATGSAGKQEPQGVYRVGGNVSAPTIVYKVDPEYSEEARVAGLVGHVTLQLVVDSAGRARNIRVGRSLGLGLDEKAIEAVNKWKFQPGYQSGQPVLVQATVNFDLLLT